MESEKQTSSIEREVELLQAVEQANDHLSPEVLADYMLQGKADLLVVDIRPAAEFNQYHLPNAQNIAMKDIHSALEPYKNKGIIVLYSNGMTHPAQTRDSLSRNGFENVYILTDGIDGFIERCLTPVSLRREPVGILEANKINGWRKFFLGNTTQTPKSESETVETSPPLVDVDWLERGISTTNVKIIDLRSQPEYNTSHIPNSLALNMENLRTNLNGVGSMLQPARVLANHFSQMGIQPQDTITIVYGEKTQDATLVAIALERLGHKKYSILNGGFDAWKSAGKILTTDLPIVAVSNYPAWENDSFTVDYLTVSQYAVSKKAVILDVRPADYFQGVKSDEARAGHIPGAINRAYSDDLVKINDIPQFKSVSELEAAYQAILPDKNAKIIIHCRTGHQASQTFFVLKRLLGYENLLWYDAGWSEWTARKELPIE